MKTPYRLFDALRRNSHPAAASLVDGLLKGQVNRRDFLRRGSVLGLSLPAMSSALTALGMAGFSTPARAQAGGAIRVGQVTPAAAIDPIKIADGPGLAMLNQVGDFLTFSGPDLVLQPQLATEWAPNADGTVWTFKIRQGVKFNDGRPMTAKDVAATFNRLADPKNGSNALSAFEGTLTTGNAKAIDDSTVEFTLDAPNGNFPYIVSSDNYNAIILPEDYDGNFEANWVGTGPWKLESYTPKVGATFVRNPNYWGPPAGPERSEFKFYNDIQAQILALQGGEIDALKQITVLEAGALLNDPAYSVIALPSNQHCQVSMRCDSDTFKDPRVRRALALSIDRNAVVNGLMRGRAKIGNDSPFSSLYPSTNKDIPQRQQDLAQAKELLAAAGVTNGASTLTCERYLEVPQYAQVLQQMFAQVGFNLTLNVMEQGPYYADATYGNSPWLDSEMSGVIYGHRGVPNVYLRAPLLSTGTWNAAHYKNPAYDQRVSAYIAALDLAEQQREAGEIQKILLEDTPILFTYFTEYLAMSRADVTGVQVTGMSQIYVNNAARKG